MYKNLKDLAKIPSTLQKYLINSQEALITILLKTDSSLDFLQYTSCFKIWCASLQKHEEKKAKFLIKLWIKLDSILHKNFTPKSKPSFYDLLIAIGPHKDVEKYWILSLECELWDKNIYKMSDSILPQLIDICNSNDEIFNDWLVYWSTKKLHVSIIKNEKIDIKTVLKLLKMTKKSGKNKIFDEFYLDFLYCTILFKNLTSWELSNENSLNLLNNCYKKSKLVIMCDLKIRNVELFCYILKCMALYYKLYQNSYKETKMWSNIYIFARQNNLPLDVELAVIHLANLAIENNDYKLSVKLMKMIKHAGKSNYFAFMFLVLKICVYGKNYQHFDQNILKIENCVNLISGTSKIFIKGQKYFHMFMANNYFDQNHKTGFSSIDLTFLMLSSSNTLMSSLNVRSEKYYACTIFDYLTFILFHVSVVKTGLVHQIQFGVVSVAQQLANELIRLAEIHQLQNLACEIWCHFTNINIIMGDVSSAVVNINNCFACHYHKPFKSENLLNSTKDITNYMSTVSDLVDSDSENYKTDDANVTFNLNLEILETDNLKDSNIENFEFVDIRKEYPVPDYWNHDECECKNCKNVEKKNIDLLRYTLVANLQTDLNERENLYLSIIKFCQNTLSSESGSNLCTHINQVVFSTRHDSDASDIGEIVDNLKMINFNSSKPKKVDSDPKSINCITNTKNYNTKLLDTIVFSYWSITKFFFSINKFEIYFQFLKNLKALSKLHFMRLNPNIMNSFIHRTLYSMSKMFSTRYHRDNTSFEVIVKKTQKANFVEKMNCINIQESNDFNNMLKTPKKVLLYKYKIPVVNKLKSVHRTKKCLHLLNEPDSESKNEINFSVSFDDFKTPLKKSQRITRSMKKCTEPEKERGTGEKYSNVMLDKLGSCAFKSIHLDSDVENSNTNKNSLDFCLYLQNVLGELFSNSFRLDSEFYKILNQTIYLNSNSIFQFNRDIKVAEIGMYHLALSHSNVFRVSMLSSLFFKKKILLKKDHLSYLDNIEFLQNFLDFDGVSKSLDSFSSFIPKGVFVIQISYIDIPFYNYNFLVITRFYTKNEKCSTVSVKICIKDKFIEDHNDQFQDIMNNNVESLRISNRKEWWKERKNLDSKFKKFLNTLEEELFGPFRIFLLCFNNNLKNEHDILCDKYNVTNDYEKKIVLIILQGAKYLRHCEVVYLLKNLLSLNCKFSEMASYMLTISTVNKPIQCIYVIDKDLQQFPLESLPVNIESNQSITRMPSLMSIVYLVKIQEMDSLMVNGANVDNAYYILNPDLTLPKSQERFKKSFEDVYKWTGTIGKTPTASHLIRVLKDYHLFWYFGHNDGSKYLPSRNLEISKCKSLVFLVGCNSGRLRAKGYLDPQGYIHSYILAGCPSAMAMLWTVTDASIDNYMELFIKKWCFNNDTKSNENENILLKPVNMAQSMTLCRKYCNLTSLIGAAPVIYGLHVNKIE